jgi:polyisoprenoid-binding protein YceI
MRRTIAWVLGGLLLAGAVLIGWLYFAGGSGEPSTELTTPTLAGEETAPPADAPETSSTDPLDPSTTAGSGQAVAFVIDPSQSVASFEIDEILRGEPNRVVGTTSEVAGQVAVDLADSSQVQFSQMIINARTFETDSGQRDRQIRGPIILDSASDEFEFITFDVTSVEGLSGPLTVGEDVAFTLNGDLQIRGTTQPVAFDVTATLVDDTTVQGVAETTVTRSDFEIGIPSVPSVADVGDEVVIRLEFVAVAA